MLERHPEEWLGDERRVVPLLGPRADDGGVRNACAGSEPRPLASRGKCS